MKKYFSIEEYLSAQPKNFRIELEKIRALVKKLVPGVTEKISYGMPMFFYPTMFFGYAAFKNHCSIFPCSKSVIVQFEKELISYKASAGTAQFTPEKPIPQKLLKKIILTRLAEIELKNSINFSPKKTSPKKN